MKNIIRPPQQNQIKELLIFISGLLTGAALTCKKNLWEMLEEDDIIFNKPRNNSSGKNKQKEKETEED